jgi:hypothetical protein
MKVDETTTSNTMAHLHERKMNFKSNDELYGLKYP